MVSTVEEPESDGNVEEDEEGAIRIGDIYIPPPPLPCLTFDPTGPRLMISDIVIENFKSYGGKVALGPFQKNFSAIVGPNGSGKSNVIDSMLFVFGYRAQKIRSQTVGVLIHSSDTYPNLTSCSVSVHFQKIIDKTGDDFEVVKGSEFVISRTAYKDNSSNYSINNRKVPFKEVSRLLRSHGIDLDHNRFLILQGEVEQISLMKPKSPNEHDTGMLEFLEDIIGSGRFKEPIELLARKVEELNELRTEKLKRVKAVEKEKDELEKPKNEAIEYINCKNHCTVKEHALTQSYMHTRKKKIQDTIEKKQMIETEQAEFLANFHKVEKDIAVAEKERNDLAKAFTKVCKAHEDKQAEINELEILDLKRREDLKHTTGKIKEMVKTLEKEKKKLDDLEELPEKLEAEIASLQSRLDGKLAKQKLEFEADEQRVMAGLRDETKDIQTEKDKLEQKLMGLQKPVDEALAKVGVAQVELDLYTKNAQDEENRLREIQTAIEKNVTGRQQMETEMKSLSVELPRVEEVLAKDAAELQAVTRCEAQTTETFKSQRSKLEEMRNAMQTSHSRGRVLEALMREKTAGRIRGIIGRLGDLGAIEEKYDIAISTACRPLDNIVTETMTSAEECVAFLKQHNLGQATFIALDKMQSWNEHIKKKFMPPRGVCRLFDLIKVKDTSVLPAFYFALRDTLVADDINQATAIGLQGKTRYRVVTLKGELIETSGTMSGGGNRPMRGRMGTSVAADAVSPQQVEELRLEVQQLQNRLEELAPRKLQLQESVVTQERLAQQMKHTIQKRKMEFEGVTQQNAALKVQLKEQEKRVKAAALDERKTQELTDKLNREKKEFDKADKAASKVKEIIQRLHDQIMEINGSKLKAVQQRVRDIEQQIDEATSAVNKKKVGVKTAKRNFTKSQEKIASVEVEIQEGREKITSLRMALEEAEGIATKLFEFVGNLKDERAKVEETLSRVTGGAESLKAELQEMKSRKMDVDHELKQLTSVLQIEESQMNKWKNELAKMSLEEAEGCEKLELKTLSEEELQEFDVKACNYAITVLVENLRKTKPNLAAIAEYCRKEDVYLQRVAEMDAMTKERDAQRDHHDGLRKQRLTEFMKGFGIITQKLKETYQMLTLGGDAELELVNSLDPFSDGIVFSVRPPRKSWKNISNLSGGEKTLSSLALVFALHYYKPTPFYVMDEIDAALDFRNVTIVGHYIKEQTKNAQFIVISLRNNMFELADRLVGVYKTYNTSHSVAIDPRTASNAPSA